MDDSFLSLAPEWVRSRCGDNIYAVTDLCRLQLLKNMLEKGYDRAVWVDADVLVFAPENLKIATEHGHGFAHELFFRFEHDGHYTALESINNSVMVFEKGQMLLDQYIAAAFNALRQSPEGPIPRTALGPTVLQKAYPQHELDRIYGVGLFTLAMMYEIVHGGGNLISDYVCAVPEPLGAANLCHFLRNETPVTHREQFDRLYMNAVDKLMCSDSDVRMQVSAQ
jgi:hypothetical protein